MKTMPFKEGLEEWKRTQESIELARQIINPPKIEPIIIPLEKRKTTRRAERVIYGEVKWKPIDKQASLLLSKAPWWAHPIPDIKEIREEKSLETTKKTKKIRKHKNMNGGDASVPASRPFGYDAAKVRTEVVNGEVMINFDDISVMVIDRINKHPQELTALARAAVDARRVLSESMDGLGGVLENFQSNSKIMLEDIRQTRFSMVSEINQMNKEIKELRQFFLGPDYKEEITRLKEFVDLCEKLQKLKDSGMLDAIGDTMIKLAR